MIYKIKLLPVKKLKGPFFSFCKLDFYCSMNDWEISVKQETLYYIVVIGFVKCCYRQSWLHYSAEYAIK